jgi:hypothetical protein
MASDYRLSPALGARLVGLLTVGVALLVFVATGVVAVLDLHTVWLLPVAVVAVALVLGVGTRLRTTPVVHLDDEGYRVRLVRGAGVRSARWKDVAEAVAASPRGIPCLVLRLTDGRSTTIPVQAVAADREELARDVREHLRRGEGLRPLEG